jgi:hypothetical protein
MSEIFTRMTKIMQDVTGITKDRKNQAQGYSFRGIDDVYNELHDVLAKHEVFTLSEILDEKSEERQTAKGGLLLYRILKIKYTFYTIDGSSVSTVVIGEGMDSGDKASNKAMSVAHKYALLQAFCIPTEDAKDPECDSPRPEPKQDTKPTDELAELCGKIAKELGYDKEAYSMLVISKGKNYTQVKVHLNEQIVNLKNQLRAIYNTQPEAERNSGLMGLDNLSVSEIKAEIKRIGELQLY